MRRGLFVWVDVAPRRTPRVVRRPASISLYSISSRSAAKRKETVVHHLQILVLDGVADQPYIIACSHAGSTWPENPRIPCTTRTLDGQGRLRQEFETLHAPNGGAAWHGMRWAAGHWRLAAGLLQPRRLARLARLALATSTMDVALDGLSSTKASGAGVAGTKSARTVPRSVKLSSPLDRTGCAGLRSHACTSTYCTGSG